MRPPPGPKLAVTIVHPSKTGAVEAHMVTTNKRSDTAARFGWWTSITELSNARVCLDVASFANAHGLDPAQLDPDNAVLDDFMVRAKEPELGFWVMAGDQKRRFELEKTLPSSVIGTDHTIAHEEEVETGRKLTECVEDLRNSNGDVMGCKRYETRAETKWVTDGRQDTVVLAFGGARYCAANDGMIAPDAHSFDLWLGERDYHNDPVLYRVALTGGQAKSGAWGGRGGLSGIERPASADIRAGTTTEADLLRHATAKLDLRPLRFVRPDGKTAYELTATGELRNGKYLSMKYERNGTIRKADGTAFAALDADGQIWIYRNRKVVELYARIKGDAIEMLDSSSTYTYAKGRFSSTSKGATTTYKDRVEPTVSPVLALVVLATLGPGFLTK